MRQTSLFSLFLVICLLLTGCPTMEPYPQKTIEKPKTPPPPRTLPERTEEPVHTMTLMGAPEIANICLKNAIISTFKIPEEFIESETFTDRTANIRLLNPATDTTGVSIDLRPEDEKTEAKMYANGTTVSKAWTKVLLKCK